MECTFGCACCGFRHFRYAGEMYEGKHTPIIAKGLFDRVQKVLALRGRVQKLKKSPQALCGLLKCGECGCSITAEVKTKMQQNGNTHRYVYYRCTKKRGACSAMYMREEVLDAELSALLALFHLPREWAAEMERMAEKDAHDASASAEASIRALRAEIAVCDGKIARLTDLFVEQDIDRAEYLARKRVLADERRALEDKVLKFERDAGHWLAPLRQWIQEAQTMGEIAKSEDLPLKKSSLQKIFGSHLALHARKARGTAKMHWLSLPPTKESQYQNALFQDLVPIVVTPRGIEPRFRA